MAEWSKRQELKYIREAQAPTPGTIFANDASNGNDMDITTEWEPSEFFLQWSQMSAVSREAEQEAWYSGFREASAQYEEGLAGLAEKLRLVQIESETTRLAAESALAVSEEVLEQPTGFDLGAMFKGIQGSTFLILAAILGLAVLKD